MCELKNLWLVTDATNRTSVQVKWPNKTKKKKPRQKCQTTVVSSRPLKWTSGDWVEVKLTNDPCCVCLSEELKNESLRNWEVIWSSSVVDGAQPVINPRRQLLVWPVGPVFICHAESCSQRRDYHQLHYCWYSWHLVFWNVLFSSVSESVMDATSRVSQCLSVIHFQMHNEWKTLLDN